MRPMSSLLLCACLAFFALPGFAKTLPEVRTMVDSKASGALAAAEALAKATPNDANAWVLLVRARLQARQAEKAIAAGEKATAADRRTRRRSTGWAMPTETASARSACCRK